MTRARRPEGGEEMSYDVVLKTIEPQAAVAIHRQVPIAGISGVMQQAIPAAWGHAASHGADVKGVYARFFSVGPAMADLDVGLILGAAIEGAGEIEAKQLPGGEVACLVYTGPYDGMEPAYHAIEDWMRAEGRGPTGPPWELYLSDPSSEPDPQKWQTEIYWPVG
jgi:effector-binding domain-containing protein